jgi:hypothetical protein
MYDIWERGEMHTKFLSENLKGRDQLEDLGIHQMIIFEQFLEKQGGKL